MTETVNYFDKPEGLVRWMLVCAIGAICERGEMKFGDLDLDPEAIQIEFKLNGHEVPFEELIEEIEKQHRSQVIEEAKKLIVLKFSGLSDMLYDLEQECVEKVNAVMHVLENTDSGRPLPEKE